MREFCNPEESTWIAEFCTKYIEKPDLMTIL
jgi:hypothetical protein